MNSSKIKAAATRALIAADANYYSWTAKQQEQFRVNVNKETNSRIAPVLLSELLNISCTSEDVTDAWNDVSQPELDNLNWAKLLTAGIGEDMIYLNESMAEGRSLLNFTSLYDYDFDDHLFQEKTNNKEIKAYQARGYYALRFSRWARLLINEKFTYATLYSLAGYLTETLEDKGRQVIDVLIPHEYVEGDNHGKQEKGGTLWNMKVDASGQEKQLDELNSRWHEYTQQRWISLSQQCVNSPPSVFINDTSDEDGPHTNFIFNNEAALKATCWKKFVQDCKKQQCDFSIVEAMENKELEIAKNWLQENYDDIMKNFDPSILPFKKKMKIIMAPGVFDGLVDDDERE